MRIVQLYNSLEYFTRVILTRRIAMLRALWPHHDCEQLRIGSRRRSDVELRTSKALHKYMHEIHADRDHGMCNIQNRTIPVAQLTQLKKLSTKKQFGALVFSNAYSIAKCFRTKWQHRK
jgi:hypothetical protein